MNSLHTPSVRIIVPASLSMVGLLQAAAQKLAEQAGLDTGHRYRIELAIEELVNILLHYAFDDDEGGELELTLAIAPPWFRLILHSRGLPFDLSMIPEFVPSAAATADDLQPQEASLSAFLLKHVADRYQLVNDGKQGYRFEVDWFLPGDHIAQLEPATLTPATVSADVPEPLHTIRPLTADDAIGLARLVYRNYGYSYIAEDFYYPERIRAYLNSGRIRSWVAVTASGRLIGHLGLKKEHPDGPAVECGMAVVDPDWRGGGVMKQLMATAMDAVAHQSEPVTYVRAVTAHDYSQKACWRFGYQPVALTLCLGPSELHFRGINEQLPQRESLFLGVRIMQPWVEQPVYLPEHHAPALQRLAAALDLPLTPGTEQRAPADQTAFSSAIIASLNVAQMNIDHIGADYAEAITGELLRLCRERVDVIYLSVDLTDPAAPALVTAAETLGFFLAGFTPMLPRPYSMTLQYLNNLDVDYQAIQAHGELAAWLKQLVADEQQRVEQLVFGNVKKAAG